MICDMRKEFELAHFRVHLPTSVTVIEVHMPYFHTASGCGVRKSGDIFYIVGLNFGKPKGYRPLLTKLPVPRIQGNPPVGDSDDMSDNF